MSIRCFSLVRLSTGATIHTVANQLKESSFEKELKKVFMTTKSLLNIDERQKITTADGAWYVTLDSQGLTYLVSTSTDYPERHAYGMIQEVKNSLSQKLGGYASASDPSIKGAVGNQMSELIRKFNDLKSIDKIYQVQDNVNQTQQIVTKNIEKMFENQTAINDLERSADKLKSESFSFNKNSSDLRKIMWTRNLKLKIILAILIVVILLCILIPVLSKVT